MRLYRHTSSSGTGIPPPLAPPPVPCPAPAATVSFPRPPRSLRPAARASPWRRPARAPRAARGTAPCAPRPAAAAAPALARACLQGRRGQAAGHLRSRRVPCLTLAPGVEGAARCHGCRVLDASGNGGDGCVGKVLRVHARRHQPVLPVVEAQSTLRSVAPRPQLARLRHRQRVDVAAGNRAHLGPLKHLLRPHQRWHKSVVGVAQASWPESAKCDAVRKIVGSWCMWYGPCACVCMSLERGWWEYEAGAVCDGSMNYWQGCTCT